MVRVGPNVKENLSEVSLDTLAKRRQAEQADLALTYDAAKMAVLNEAYRQAQLHFGEVPQADRVIRLDALGLEHQLP